MLRLRIFIGPNGSGKSSLYKQLKGKFNLGIYINPDDIHSMLQESSILDFEDFHILAKQQKWEHFWKSHGLSQKAPLLKKSHVTHNILVLQAKAGPYESSIISDFIRHTILNTQETFSFESVFSHPSKLAFLKKANTHNYQCYLYFVATSSPELCMDRVQQRTSEGGHDVPVGKIKSRYYLSLQNLFPAMQIAHRAFLFDNSYKMKLIAEMSPTKSLKIKENHIPIWLKEYVLDKL
jgi:predicted ABC-type ATPase